MHCKQTGGARWNLCEHSQPRFGLTGLVEFDCAVLCADCRQEVQRIYFLLAFLLAFYAMNVQYSRYPLSFFQLSFFQFDSLELAGGHRRR